MSYSGLDAGFRKGGWAGAGGSFWTILSKNEKFLNFHQNRHENEITLAKRNVRATPLNPLWIRPWSHSSFFILDINKICFQTAYFLKSQFAYFLCCLTYLFIQWMMPIYQVTPGFLWRVCFSRLYSSVPQLSPIKRKCVFKSLRPGNIQTSLLSYRDYLESCNFGSRNKRYYTIQGANNRSADQTARMRSLICAFVVRIWHKTHFRMTWLNFS